MKTCLVVDDSKVVRKVARRMLEEMGFQVDEAEHGKVALDYCLKTIPDLILLDWNMPEMDGMQFFQEFIKLPEHSKAKVMFCTTENDFSKIEQAISSGADEYIMKPFDAEILKGKLEQIGFF